MPGYHASWCALQRLRFLRHSAPPSRSKRVELWRLLATCWWRSKDGPSHSCISFASLVKHYLLGTRYWCLILPTLALTIMSFLIFPSFTLFLFPRPKELTGFMIEENGDHCLFFFFFFCPSILASERRISWYDERSLMTYHFFFL